MYRPVSEFRVIRNTVPEVVASTHKGSNSTKTSNISHAKSATSGVNRGCYVPIKGYFTKFTYILFAKQKKPQSNADEKNNDTNLKINKLRLIQK